jgi:hypothetical protein
LDFFVFFFVDHHLWTWRLEVVIAAHVVLVVWLTLNSPIDYWHVFEVVDVWTFYLEHSTSDF